MWKTRVFQIHNYSKCGFLFLFLIPALTDLDDFSVHLQVKANRI